MPRVKTARRKVEYIQTFLKRRGGDPIDCNQCGYTGEADLIESTALGSGFLERCPICRSKNFVYKEPVMPWKTDEWKGCYPSSWKGMIVQEAMSHPAKFSSKLIRRIYEHMRAEGWVKAGDRVIDPFGGVALGSLDAMRLGLEWFGVELELKFVDLGQHNISNWEAKYHGMPKWGRAVLCQGDSRKLIQVLRGNSSAAATKSSPPYAESEVTAGNVGGKMMDKWGDGKRLKVEDGIAYGNSDGQLGAMKGDNFDASVGSPPYAMTDLHYKKNGIRENGKDKYERPYMEGQGQDNYGETEGNLGEMRGDNFEASISSPPFIDQSADGGWQMLDKYAKEGKLTIKQAKGDPNKSYPSWAEGRDTSYGESEGQLSAMEPGDFSAAITSPPYKTETQGSGLNVDKPDSFRGVLKDGTLSMGESEGNLGSMDDGNFEAAMKSPPYEGNIVKARSSYLEVERTARKGMDRTPGMTGDVLAQEQYGQAEGQLGNDSGDDFWVAARQIVEQVYLALAPGGHAVWVVKDYVKSKERVPFSDQWRQLCEAVGFITLHEHRALLVNATSLTLDGGEKHHESKSFFRRLAEKKGSPKINWETVWCMEKPMVLPMPAHYVGDNGR